MIDILEYIEIYRGLCQDYCLDAVFFLCELIGFFCVGGVCL